MKHYTKEDDAALAHAWFPEASRPYNYVVRKSHYNYKTKQWNYEVYKTIDGSYALQLSTQNQLNEDEAQAMLDWAIESGNPEIYFAERLEAQRVIWAAEAELKRKAKAAISEIYWNNRNALLDEAIAEFKSKGV